METKLIGLIPALPLLGALINLTIGRKSSRGFVHTVAIAAVVGSLAVSVALVVGPLWDSYQLWHGLRESGSGPETMPALTHSLWSWIHVGSLQIDLAFQLDTLSAVMILIITFVGSLIHIYSTGYMAEEPRYADYFGYLNLFMGSMLILVLADSLPVMFIGWEGVGVCSYLLIGFWFSKEANANAGRKAFIVNRVGDFAFLLGICLLFWATGTLEFHDFQSAANSDIFKQGFGGERLATWAGVLLFIGACGKSAQIPLYVWLPDAMAGPTPVSALIHAATMVTAGVYMIARLSFLYAHSTAAMAVVAGIGALTALFAAIMAFAQTDLKKVLAYSTVSQLGFMFVGVGVGAYVAGIFHLLTHAFFKAGLFLAAGSVMHAMSGSGDIMTMGGLRKLLPRTHFSFLIYCLAIAGIFPFAGFFSKDEILAGAFAAHAEGWLPAYGKILWVTLSLAAVGTAFYMFRLYFLVFAGKEVRCDDETRAHIHESPPSMTTPLIVLAVFTIFLGFIGLPHLSFIPENFLILPRWLDASLIDFSRASLEDSLPPHHASDVTTLGLMAAATVLAIGGICVAWMLYGRGPSRAVGRLTATAPGAEVHRVVKNKFYVDEIYEAVILRPFRLTAAFLFEVVDRFFIDTLVVNGSAFLVGTGGRVLRWVQNGQVQRYIAALVVGAALLFAFAGRSRADFRYEQAGGQVEFFPLLGAGASAEGAEIEFDFDFDGAPDRSYRYDHQHPVKITWPFTGPGDYKVRMWVTDSMFKQRNDVVKTIRVESAERLPEGRP